MMIRCEHLFGLPDGRESPCDWIADTTLKLPGGLTVHLCLVHTRALAAIDPQVASQM